jgi:uncharacterized protein (UPF0332 family)
VKQETAAFLQKAREFLDKAQGMLANGWPDEAGRASYLAGLHAAKAFLFERSGEITKSHKRVRAEFGRLIKNDARFDVELRAFLGRSFDLKALADYETGPGSMVSAERAGTAVQTARRFVECVAGLIPANDHVPRAPDAEPKP